MIINYNITFILSFSGTFLKLKKKCNVTYTTKNSSMICSLLLHYRSLVVQMLNFALWTTARYPYRTMDNVIFACSLW